MQLNIADCKKQQTKETSSKAEQETQDEETSSDEIECEPSKESYELLEFVIDKLFAYNSWVGKTSKGKIYLRVALIGTMRCNVETGEVGASLADDGTDYDLCDYLIKASDSELQLKYQRTTNERDYRIPPELKNITLKKQSDGYILAAQSYLRKNVNSYKESLSRINYKKKKLNKNTSEVVITGVYESYTERKRKYKKKLVITKIGDEYKVE